MEFQHDDTEILNLTLYGRSNHSSLYLHLPEEEDEQKKTGDEGQEKSFYCCLPSEFANQSHCLLWLSNQTVLTAKEKLPWKQTLKGWCQGARAVPLCSLCGQCGFILKIGEEGIKSKASGQSVFI